MLVRHDHPASSGDLAFTKAMVKNVQFGSAYRENGDVAAMRAATERMLSMPFVRGVAEGLLPLPDAIGGVPGEWLTPEKTTRAGTLVFFHGGGYVRGSLALGRSNAAELAARLGMRCFSVDYRQAPEHPFPAPVEDAVAVCRGLTNADSGPLLLAGESAGGGIVVAAAMRLREMKSQLPTALVAVSPFFDMTQSGESWETNAENDITTRPMGRQLVGLYMGDRDLRDPLASPLFGRFDALPPLMVKVGRHEALLSEALELAERASAAGVNVTLDVFDGMPHGFIKYRLEAATLALERAAMWLTRFSAKLAL